MRSLFVVYSVKEKKKKRTYFRADNMIALLSYLKWGCFVGEIKQVKKLKRTYRKTDYIMEVIL